MRKLLVFFIFLIGIMFFFPSETNAAQVQEGYRSSAEVGFFGAYDSQLNANTQANSIEQNKLSFIPQFGDSPTLTYTLLGLSLLFFMLIIWIFRILMKKRKKEF